MRKLHKNFWIRKLNNMNVVIWIIFIFSLVISCQTAGYYEISKKKKLTNQRTALMTVQKHLYSGNIGNIDLYIQTLDCNLFSYSIGRKRDTLTTKRITCKEMEEATRKIWSAMDRIAKSKGIARDSVQKVFYMKAFLDRDKKYASVQVDSASIYNLYLDNYKQWKIFKRSDWNNCGKCLEDTLGKTLE